MIYNFSSTLSFSCTFTFFSLLLLIQFKSIFSGQNGVDSVFIIISTIFVIIFASIRLFCELYQFITLKLYYFLNWVNYIEVSLSFCAIIFSSVYITDCLCPTVWQWQIGCVAVFLAWLNFICFIRKLPFIGNITFVEMYLLK